MKNLVSLIGTLFLGISSNFIHPELFVRFNHKQGWPQLNREPLQSVLGLAARHFFLPFRRTNVCSM